MDIATLVGIIGATVMIVGSMIYAGGVAPFVDYASIVIVFGGTVFVVMLTKPMDVFLSHFKAMGKAFKSSVPPVETLIERMVELSTIARKDGMMALEGQQVPDRFFERGLQMLIDGADEYKLASQLQDEIAAMKARHQAKQDVVKAWVELGPAYGMIGTLIGLVEMMGNMEDTAAIGQGMATALIGTLYGAIAANVLFGPLASKMKNNTTIEVQYREMVIEGLRAISRGESARNIQDSMVCVLPPVQQAKFQAA